MRSLLEVVRSVMWYADGFTGGSPVEVELPVRDGEAVPSWELGADSLPRARMRAESIAPSAPNLLMFLSDVRGRAHAPGVFLASSVLRAAELMRFAAAAVARGHYLPDVRRGPAGEPEAWWRAAPTAGEELALRALAPDADGRALFGWLLDGLVRSASATALSRRIAPDDRFETFHDAWLAALRTEDRRVPTGQVRSYSPDDPDGLRRHLDEWSASLAESPEARAAMVFALEPPADGHGAWRVRLPRAPATRQGLLALGQAAAVFPALRSFRLGEGGFAAEISRADAEAFIRVGAHALRAAGYEATVPEGIVGEHVTAAAEVTAGDDGTAGGPDAAVSAKLTVHVDGEAVTEDEIAFLLDQGSPVVFFRNRWIEVDRNVLREALKALRDIRGRRLKLRDAVRFAVGVGRAGRLRVKSLAAHGWLRGLLNELTGAEKFALLDAPPGFRGELKPFQRRGYSWLAFLAKWGFGACLADDMGLGKTVQSIAFILHLLAAAPAVGAVVLVVAPLTVLGNWRREFARFAPGLRVMVHHGADRATGVSFAREAAKAQVVLTSYSLLVRDFGAIASADLSALVLDEAQTVKNADTRVSRAVRALDAPVRVALTGTPLENSVNDIWALEDFLNPGLLGERARFADDFARPIAADPSGGAMNRLRRVLAPFVLRRLKTDPAIDLQLGDKRETREYCPLTPEQRRRYEDALYAFREDRDRSAGEPASGRRGRVLALLTELKEVCDAPALVRMRDGGGDGSAAAGLEAESGKVMRLDELLEEIFENGESALVFTQYARMGELLRAHLLERFGRSMPFLHGGLDPRAREAEIAAFDRAGEPQAFILSLKAGGFGLNLTRATHVIHFDRWWNPAVEAQATDRAHRIGQSRTVYVHVFVCSGTVEDRVDQLLESKKQLADGAITSGESFLASMSDAELEEFLALSDEGADGAGGGKGVRDV